MQPDKAMRRRLLNSGGGDCFFCGVLGAGTIDHLIPQSQGGTDDPVNVVACCRSCNQAKGSQPVVEWLKRQKFGTPKKVAAVKDRLAVAREWVL